MSDTSPFSIKTQQALEADDANKREAFDLLALTNAEFTTDPMSVQCFDLRIVERLRVCVERRKAFEREYAAWV